MREILIIFQFPIRLRKKANLGKICYVVILTTSVIVYPYCDVRTFWPISRFVFNTFSVFISKVTADIEKTVPFWNGENGAGMMLNLDRVPLKFELAIITTL